MNENTRLKIEALEQKRDQLRKERNDIFVDAFKTGNPNFDPAHTERLAQEIWEVGQELKLLGVEDKVPEESEDDA